MDIAWLGLFIASDWLEPLGKKIDTDPFFSRVLKKQIITVEDAAAT
ncbi:MAG: hypothetical protein P8185_07185 [Deltaproteobacteria bacterium]|jgi:hypothetical protein